MGAATAQGRINLYIMISSSLFIHIFVSWLFGALLCGECTPLLVCQRNEKESVVNSSSMDRRGLLESRLRLSGRTDWRDQNKGFRQWKTNFCFSSCLILLHNSCFNLNPTFIQICCETVGAAGLLLINCVCSQCQSLKQVHPKYRNY